MKILFIHQNFPGQFRSLAQALAARSDNLVLALTMRRTEERHWNGVHLVPYTVSRGSSGEIHPWLRDFEPKVIRGEGCFRACSALKAQGFAPDLILAHPGWGESLFVKEVWPQARLGIYCEFYYRAEGADIGFDPEFSPGSEETACLTRLKNCNSTMHFAIATAGISPTRWQASTFPEPFRSRISIIHDGIDTNAVVPDPRVRLTINGSLNLTRRDEVITFISRNLEPYRGFHIFMRSLPELLKRRPRAHVLIVGGDGVSYGGRPPGNQTWRKFLIDETSPHCSPEDWSRVHFLGTLPYQYFLAVLQLSSVHVYLTYPFVLSWSLLEAMSAGCAVVASATAPVQEVIASGVTGVLVDFFDRQGLVTAISDLLDHPQQRERLGANARAFVQRTYDLRSICLPRQFEWLRHVMDCQG